MLEKPERLNVQLKVETYERLKAAKSLTGLSLNELIGRCVDEGLEAVILEPEVRERTRIHTAERERERAQGLDLLRTAQSDREPKP